ncbi:hypothetical protein CC80DRAFT_549126 [Byssothecium circinans]|uniref:DUF7918 domain-containing protein n=1 Tax=Byssothecium circinans TaxID=147558 RepID=A0A6A5TR84_9PLEO|nr:hypothetical protein CC80DRAFT_549126 [Byssothecium circinans]
MEYEDRTARSKPQSKSSLTHTVKRFVEANTGANFEIRPHELYDKDGHVSAGSIANTSSDFFLQKYKLSSLDVEESDDMPVPEALKLKLEPVGTILLRFRFLENPRRNSTVEQEGRNLEALGTVNKKGDALSHTVSLAQAELTDNVEFSDAASADDKKPIATFPFHYRSLDALQALHVVPCTPDSLDLEDCDEEIIHRSNRADIAALTVVGDNGILGDGDDDIIFVGVGPVPERKKLDRQVPQG